LDPNERLPLIGPKLAQVAKRNPDPGPRCGLRAVRTVAQGKGHGPILFPGRIPVMNSKILYFIFCSDIV
jgi:hypothetical protein